MTEKEFIPLFKYKVLEIVRNRIKSIPLEEAELYIEDSFFEESPKSIYSAIVLPDGNVDFIADNINEYANDMAQQIIIWIKTHEGLDKCLNENISILDDVFFQVEIPEIDFPVNDSVGKCMRLCCLYRFRQIEKAYC